MVFVHAPNLDAADRLRLLKDSISNNWYVCGEEEASFLKLKYKDISVETPPTLTYYPTPYCPKIPHGL